MHPLNHPKIARSVRVRADKMIVHGKIVKTCKFILVHIVMFERTCLLFSHLFHILSILYLWKHYLLPDPSSSARIVRHASDFTNIFLHLCIEERMNQKILTSYLAGIPLSS
jgi:hypothetical protein